MTDSPFIPPKKLLLIAQAPASFYRQNLIDGFQQLFIGPDVVDEGIRSSTQSSTMHLRQDWLDGNSLASALKHIDFEPAIVAIKADATRRCHIRNLDSLPGKKILLMGDTHHMPTPLQVMLGYALSEPWDLVSSEHDRHHLPLFRQGGIRNLIWLPCFTMNPFRFPPQRVDNQQTIFVGSLSQHHIQRQRLIERLRSLGTQVAVKSASQRDAAALYNQTAISLNVSLNGDLNFRVMEVLAAGGCLLTDRLGPDSGLNELLEEGIHYLAYSTPEEASFQIEYLARNPQRRCQIAEAGYKRFWSTFGPSIQSQALLAALTNQPIPNLFRAPV